MKRMRSQLTDTVGPIGRPIAPGEVVDFDEPVGPMKLGDALGHLAASFAPADDDKPSAPVAPKGGRKATHDPAPDAPKE